MRESSPGLTGCQGLCPPRQGFTGREAPFLMEWSAVTALVLTLLSGQVELDCSRREQSRGILARLQLAEIEGAEDIHRAVMWEAFGRCGPGGAGEPCREGERRRFGALWDQQKQEIEAKYQRMRSEFEQRCRGSLSLVTPS